MTQLTNQEKLIAHHVAIIDNAKLSEDKSFDYEKYMKIKSREDFKEYLAGIQIEIFRKMYELK